LPRQAFGLARRQDRQHEIGAVEQCLFVGSGLHAGGAGALGAGGAAARQQRSHLGAPLMEALADSRAHHALRHDRNRDAHPASPPNRLGQS
jgi:hypothetical protein